MKVYNYTELSLLDIEKLVQRNTDTSNQVTAAVRTIIADVQALGDESLINYAKKFDGINLKEIYLEKEEFAVLAAKLPAEQKQALQTAYDNIYKFHQTQLKREEKIETMPGITCWRESRPIEKVGLYVPGGSAVLPSTFLMLGIPARIAGCKEIVICSPPQKDKKVNAALAYVAGLLQIDRIYLVGGAQAIAAMAYGTKTIPKVDKIFGPGNQYVTKAKSIIQAETITAIDMPAGPSEVLVIADETAISSYVASDLLAQAEHGIDSQSILVTTSTNILTDILAEVQRQLETLPRKDIAHRAMDNSYAVLVGSLVEAMVFSNSYAPEHLILATEKWPELADKITNAGSVFLGNLAPESVGDYASGTNHTLPTGGYARAYSGVSVDSFLKKITFQHLTPDGLKNIGPTVETLADMEGLQAHKNAVSVRIKSR